MTIIPTYDTDVLGYWVAENEDLLTQLKIDLAPSASRCTINLQVILFVAIMTQSIALSVCPRFVLFWLILIIRMKNAFIFMCSRYQFIKELSCTNSACISTWNSNGAPCFMWWGHIHIFIFRPNLNQRGVNIGMISAMHTLYRQSVTCSFKCTAKEILSLQSVYFEGSRN